MAQRPTHRLNLYVVPDDPEREVSVQAEQDGLAALARLGVTAGRGRPGPRAETLIQGGFALLRVDRPRGPAVYGNRQGGFHVRCPTCNMPLARPFSGAVRRWKAGSARQMICPGCGHVHDLARLEFAPPAALGLFALELRDVESPDLTPSGEVGEALERLLEGPFRVIASRGA
ncbi:MAG: hypothetical protein H6739_04210 [Alphaproteobacteria bacterium]|nr:hypothetical protein [Alphaproteobacteria bacterium]